MIDLNGIKLKNRFLVSAGALGYGHGWPWQKPLIRFGLVNPSIFGAIVARTLTLELRVGSYIDPLEFEKRSLASHLCHIFSSERKMVLRKVSGGWINNMGWWNVGIDYWMKEIYPKLKNVTIIPNIGGFIVDHYVELIQKLNPLKIAAVELNISCPNVTHSLSRNHEELIRLFSFCREASSHPLIVKLGINFDYLRIATIAEYCGLNAISAINAVPVLGGGFSGSGIKHIALKVVADIKNEVKIPVIGGGGIGSWKDCQDFFQAGADAVSFGSVHILQPWRPTLIVRQHK